MSLHICKLKSGFLLYCTCWLTFLEYCLFFCVCLIFHLVLLLITVSAIFFILCTNCLCDRWKECRSDSSHSCLRWECTCHKQRIITQGICEGRRKVNLAPHHVMYICFVMQVVVAFKGLSV